MTLCGCRYYCTPVGLNYQVFPEQVHIYPVRCELSSFDMVWFLYRFPCHLVRRLVHQFGSFARIGVPLHNLNPCRKYLAVEGIGLTTTASRFEYLDVGSGRAVFDNLATFKKAKVWVIGSTSRIRKSRIAC